MPGSRVNDFAVGPSHAPTRVPTCILQLTPTFIPRPVWGVIKVLEPPLARALGFRAAYPEYRTLGRVRAE